ncbi:MAG TPA: hypothetical protein VI306_14935 [Pyrinomonadaceae bacterium]
MRKRNLIHLACLCLLVLICGFDLQAQSGRRQPRTEPAAPIPTPTPEPTPTPSSPKKDSDTLLLVGIDNSGAFNQFPLTFYAAAVDGCTEELKRNAIVDVDSATKEMTRSDAINRAKTDPKTYVIYLQLKNQLRPEAQGTDSSEEIELEYTVFAPLTAKILANGTAYQNGRRAGPVVVSPPGTSTTSSIMYREALLKRAGAEAADRILKSLHLSSVPATH